MKIVAYSLAAQLTFMLCNALIGLLFLPRASRELTAVARRTRGQFGYRVKLSHAENGKAFSPSSFS